MRALHQFAHGRLDVPAWSVPFHDEWGYGMRTDAWSEVAVLRGGA